MLTLPNIRYVVKESSSANQAESGCQYRNIYLDICERHQLTNREIYRAAGPLIRCLLLFYSKP